MERGERSRCSSRPDFAVTLEGLPVGGVGGVDEPRRPGAIAGEVGVSRREFTHLGDAVNLASRLKDAAQPWQVLINQSTHERVVDVITAEAIEPLTVKGKSDPINAFAVSAYNGDRAAMDESLQPAVTTSVVTTAVDVEPITSAELSPAGAEIEKESLDREEGRRRYNV